MNSVYLVSETAVIVFNSLNDAQCYAHLNNIINCNFLSHNEFIVWENLEDYLKNGSSEKVIFVERPHDD
jgi:hypothetical protein